MVAVVQLVEHLVVVQDVAGSSPVSHPRWVRCELSTKGRPWLSSPGFGRGCFIWLRWLTVGGRWGWLVWPVAGCRCSRARWGCPSRSQCAAGWRPTSEPIRPSRSRRHRWTSRVPLLRTSSVLVQGVERFGERIVVGVSLGSDRGDGLAVGKGLARNGSPGTAPPDPNDGRGQRGRRPRAFAARSPFSTHQGRGRCTRLWRFANPRSDARITSAGERDESLTRCTSSRR